MQREGKRRGRGQRGGNGVAVPNRAVLKVGADIVPRVPALRHLTCALKKGGPSGYHYEQRIIHGPVL